MKKLTFDEIMQRWQRHEQASIAETKPRKGADCLTFAEFEQFRQGKPSPAQSKHVAHCEHCRKMVSFFDAWQLQQTPKPEKPGLAELINQILSKIKTISATLFEPLPVVIKWAVPVVAVAVFTFLVLQRPESELVKLAQIEPDYYQATKLRGETGPAETAKAKANQLFDEGMQAYQQQNYRQSITLLQQSFDLVPTSVNTCFYLGLSHLLLRQPDPAIDYFRKIFVLNGDFLFEKTYWYLGNAYLLKENSQKALEMFEKVIAFRSEFEWEARDLVAKIKQSQSTENEVNK